ncbi:hypothetical protein [Saccharopolyspora sp. 5N708]|uniref:hypothetical protein n=1 Tax=Saccharopolyspora sp. 5N708 TaxID=3457424 RepID=UPI003FD06371
MSTPHVEVPVGIRAGEWNTVAPERTVLVVAHNVTTITRLFDVLPIFESDFRVQVVVSWSGSDPFRHGVSELLNRSGMIVIPWDQAKHTKFDLVISASHHGALTDLSSPLVILSHGIGYTKYSPGNRKPETGNRKPETGNRKPETGNRQTFGLSPQWVLYDGRPFASALVLSHDEQLDRLAAAAPEALPVARVVGDPCYDRIVASAEQRDRYRDALGTGDRTLVMVSSTWWSSSLLGTWPGLIRRLLAELPIDSFQVVAALHPNTWHGHGPGQIRSWLANCLRSGLTLLPELDGWRSGLVAADVVIGDHGSVTGYGAAIGVPTLLAAFPDDDVAPGSPIAALGEAAPRLDPAVPLRRQIEAAIRRHAPSASAAVAQLVTSAAGEALHRLRALCYELMRLPEPADELPVAPVPSTAVPAEDRAPSLLAFRAEHVVDTRTRTVRFVRHPAELTRGGPEFAAPAEQPDTHLCCPFDYPLRTIRRAAAVLVRQRGDLPEQAEGWLSDTFERNPSSQVVAVLDERSCTAHHRDGTRIALRAERLPPDVQACAAYAWLSATDSTLPVSITVELDERRHRVDIEAI